MLKINTTRFGEIEIEPEKLIEFPQGIPGFEEKRQFVLVPHDEQSPFLFLQSAENEALAFLVADPFYFFPQYHFEIDDGSMEELHLLSEEDITAYVILTIPAEGVKFMTANLLAPLIINQKNRKARQIVLEKSDYTTKHQVFDAPDGVRLKGGR